MHMVAMANKLATEQWPAARVYQACTLQQVYSTPGS